MYSFLTRSKTTCPGLTHSEVSGPRFLTRSKALPLLKTGKNPGGERD
jgi:hypothetical protein